MRGFSERCCITDSGCGRTMAACNSRSRRCGVNPTMNEMVMEAVGRNKDPTGIILISVHSITWCCILRSYRWDSVADMYALQMLISLLNEIRWRKFKFNQYCWLSDRKVIEPVIKIVCAVVFSMYLNYDCKAVALTSRDASTYSK